MPKSQESVGFVDLAAMMPVTHEGKRAPLLEHMEDAIRKAADASLRFAKGSKISFTIDVKPGTEENALDFQATVSVSVPQAKAAPTRLFADRKGGLYADDPRQTPITFPADAAKVGGGN